MNRSKLDFFTKIQSVEAVQNQNYVTKEDLFQQAKNYELGIGVEQNLTKAYQIYKQLSEQGCVLSTYWLGMGHFNNLFCTLSSIEYWQEGFLPEVIKYLKLHSMFDDCTYSQLLLDRIIDHNLSLAKKYFEKAASELHVDSIFMLGKIYNYYCLSFTNKVAASSFLKKAKEYFELAINLDPNNGLAKFKLSELYMLEGDLDVALTLCEAAAEANCSEAIYSLGIKYYEGEGGLEKNLELALEKITIAANLGNPLAQYKLSEFYIMGEHVKKDVFKGIELGLKSASSGCAIAQNAMGLRYEKGIYLEPNRIKAMDLYLEAAIQDLPDAQFNLAEIYNVLFDYNYYKNEKEQTIFKKRMLRLYSKAAYKNHVGAQYSLGAEYKFLARSLPKDQESHSHININILIKTNVLYQEYVQRALFWLEKAAQQEHVMASMEITYMLKLGEKKKEQIKLAIQESMRLKNKLLPWKNQQSINDNLMIKYLDLHKVMPVIIQDQMGKTEKLYIAIEDLKNDFLTNENQDELRKLKTPKKQSRNTKSKLRCDLI